MTTLKIGEPITLKAPYPIAFGAFPDGILPEHNTLFLGEGKGPWHGLWAVLVVGMFPWKTNAADLVENPIFHIEPSAFTAEAQVNGL